MRHSAPLYALSWRTPEQSCGERRWYPHDVAAGASAGRSSKSAQRPTRGSAATVRARRGAAGGLSASVKELGERGPAYWRVNLHEFIFRDATVRERFPVSARSLRSSTMHSLTVVPLIPASFICTDRSCLPPALAGGRRACSTTVSRASAGFLGRALEIHGRGVLNW